jgi:fucose permease
MLWSATYLVMVRGLDAAHAASMGGLFFIGMTLGRGIAGFIAMKLRPRQMVRLGQVMMLLGGLLLFVPGQNIAIFGLLFMGLGCAPIYPNIVQDTPRNYCAENSQAVIGVQMAFAYIGSLIMPTVFGWIAEVTGYGILPVYSLVLTAAMILLFNRQQKIVDQRNSN